MKISAATKAAGVRLTPDERHAFYSLPDLLYKSSAVKSAPPHEKTDNNSLLSVNKTEELIDFGKREVHADASVALSCSRQTVLGS